jgi:hypothetical protein
MSETNTDRPRPCTAAMAYATPAELPPGAPDSPLVVTINPPAVYIRNGGQWVPVGSVEGRRPAPSCGATRASPAGRWRATGTGASSGTGEGGIGS